MKKLLLFPFIIISLFLQSQKFTIDTLLTDKISIRAIQLWDGKVWYAGTDSKFGYVDLENVNNKKQIRLSQKSLQFRTLAQNNKYFYAINIESPAYFFQVDKKTLDSKVVFNDNDPTAFYDALKFTDHNFGLAFSDPSANQRLNISQTRNGGANWINCKNCKDFPYLEKGEAAFAASNTNIVVKGNKTWLVSGGKKARVFYSPNNGKSWQVFETPIVQGEEMTGIFTADFYDATTGIIAGGNYLKQEQNFGNKAITTNGGKTWNLIAENQGFGYASCVQFVPNSKGRRIISVGGTGLFYSADFGKSWLKFSDDKDLFTFRFASEKTFYATGKNKLIRFDIK